MYCISTVYATIKERRQCSSLALDTRLLQALRCSRLQSCKVSERDALRAPLFSQEMEKKHVSMPFHDCLLK